jgi:hypothetical protein
MPTLSLTKLVTSQDTFGEMVEKINTNFDIISQAQGLRGEEGKRGVAGIPGPPGAIGPQGTSGPNGTNGNKWYFGDDFSAFDPSFTAIGDFFLEGTTGDVRERKVSGWELVGSVIGSGAGAESNIFNSFIPLINNDTKIIKPLKTNYTLEITDISGTNINYDVSPFSDNADTANFVIGQSTTEQKWLQEMGLKIYTSEGDNTSLLYGKGKQLHLVNSSGLVANKSIGWANQSGFTLTVDWDYTTDTNLEVLRIKNIKSSDVNHKQRIEIESDRISLIGDYVFSEAPLKLYNVKKNDLTSVEYGTIVYDTDTDKVFAYRNSTPDGWIELGGSTVSPGNTGFAFAKLFDNVGTEVTSPTASLQTAGSPDTTFRLKAGSGITIEPVNVTDSGSKKAWEIRLSDSAPAGSDDFFGTVRTYKSNGTVFSIAANSQGDVLNFEEGDGIVIDDSSGKIRISTTGTGTTSSSFIGSKYFYGQGTPIDIDPNNFVQLQNMSVQNNGSINDYRNLSFTTYDGSFRLPKAIDGKTDPLNPSLGTIFNPTITGFWQINVFAFGLIDMQTDTFDPINPNYSSYTVVGALRKNSGEYSHMSIAESSFVNANAFFGLGIFGQFTNMWPTWTINCSDIMYLDDVTDTFSVSVGGLYAPNQGGSFTPLTPSYMNLYYCSGYVSAVYLGN